MQSETTLGRIFDDRLELAPVLREVLCVAADNRGGILEPYVDLPGRRVGSTSAVLLQVACVITVHPFDHMCIGKPFPDGIELCSRHGLHEIVIPHVSVIPRDEITFKIVLDLVSAAGE